MDKEDTDSPARVSLFQSREVRRVLHNDEWWFVITDVVSALTDSVNPSDYLKKMRSRDAGLAEAFKGEGQIATPLAGEFKGGGTTCPAPCPRIRYRWRSAGDPMLEY